MESSAPWQSRRDNALARGLVCIQQRLLGYQAAAIG
jgi:hypothetical protein